MSAVYRQLEELPPFNPDLDGLDPPAPVTGFEPRCRHATVTDSSRIRAWRGRCDEECARLGGGQWRVGGKAGGPHQRLTARTHAHAALMETLTVMSAHLVAAASITVPLQGRGLDASGIAADAGLATALGAAIDALASVARSGLGETR